MRRPVLVLTIAAVLSARVILTADDLVLSLFSGYLNALRTQAAIPGLSATIVGPTDVTWEQGYGYQDVDRLQRAVPDTPYEIDGLTELVTAVLVLRCVDEHGSLTLDDPVGQYAPSSPDANATLRQILSHTSPGPNGLVYSYRPERLAALVPAVSACTGQTLSPSISGLLDRLVMYDSVPGSDVAGQSPPPTGIDPSAIPRFNGVLGRLATPYAVDAGGHATPSQYSATTLTPTSGLISTVRDLAKFDLRVKDGFALHPESLALAWTPPLDGNGQRLPHGFGWFSQTYNGERVVWQFGVSDNASSSMMITVPGRGLTLILLANSQGLVKPYPLSAGDVTVSPFARLFLGTFVR